MNVVVDPASSTAKGSPSQSKKSQNHSHRIIFKSIVILLLLIAIGGVYIWQHHQVTTDSAGTKNLESETTRLQKENSSLKMQVGVLNKNLQTALSKSNSQSDTNPSTDQSPTSDLVINDVKQVPGTTYNASATSSDTYWVVDFTIYNNSASTQTYYLNQTNNYFKGVSSTGSIISPYFFGQGVGWYSSTILPGGSDHGILAFDFDAPLDVTKIQWQAPDNSQLVTLDLPSS